MATYNQEISKKIHNLKDLEFRKSVNGYDYIVMPSSYTEGIFPLYVQVQSHKTGKIVRFNHIKPEHPRYDEDGWDGEQAIYQPADLSAVNNSNLLLVVHHE
jgi:hypothetical protein